MSKEQGSQPTQVYLAFVDHDAPQASQYVKPFFRRMHTVLAENSEGSGVIFEEAIGMSPLLTEVMKERTGQGTLYSDVRAQFQFAYKHEREANIEELKKEKETWFAEYTREEPFIAAEAKTFDNLITVFPKRVHVRMEHTPWEQIEEIDKGRFASRNEDIEKSGSLEFDGKVEEALPYYKQGVERFAELQRLRNRQIADVIEEEVGVEEPPLIVQGFLGQGHTQVYHFLRREGIQVHPIFLERDSGKKENAFHAIYKKAIGTVSKVLLRRKNSQEHTDQIGVIYPPKDAMIRKLIFYPNKVISDMEWKQSLLLHTLYSLNMVMKERNLLDKNFTEPEICAYAWRARKHFDTDEKIQNFQEDMQKVGFFEAYNNLFPELRRPTEES